MLPNNFLSSVFAWVPCWNSSPLNTNVRELMMVSSRASVPGKQAGVWNEKIGCQNEME